MYEPPALYLSAMQALAVLSLAVNCFTLFAIYARSPRTMGRFRSWLCLYQLESTILEAYLHSVAAEFLFPMLGAKMNGLVAVTLPGNVALKLGGVFVVCTIFATYQCVLYRHRLILPPNHALKLSLRTWAMLGVAHYVLANALIFASFSILDVRLARDDPEFAAACAERYPAHAAVIAFGDDVWIARDEPVRWLLGATTASTLPALVFALALEACCVIGGLFPHAFWLLAYRSSFMSARTRRLNRQLLVALAVQVFIPMFTIAVPWSSFGLVIALDTPIPRALNNLLFFINSIHGLMSSLLILFLTKPYRDFLKLQFVKVGAVFGLEAARAVLKSRPSSLAMKSAVVSAVRQQLPLGQS